MDMTTDFYSDNLLCLNVDALWTSWCLETQLQNHKAGPSVLIPASGLLRGSSCIGHVAHYWNSRSWETKEGVLRV